MKRIYLFFSLFLIVLLASILRFYQLGKVPVALYWDETAFGYNAYSISQTAKDEYGTTLPLLFRSFEDYKLPGYIYLVSVSVRIFGLNAFAVRFSSAILGILTVFFVYLLVNELFLTQKKVDKNKQEIIALISAFLLAISPWHLQFSRAGFEANTALAFFVAGVFFFMKSTRNKKYLPITFLLWIASFYSYRSIHIFGSLFIPGLFAVFRKEIFTKDKRLVLLITIFVSVLLLSPLGISMFSKEGFARARQVSITTNTSEDVYMLAQQQVQSGNTWWSKVVYNRRLLYGKIFIENYISHFSPAFLFFDGDGNGRHGLPGMGLLYKWELPFLLFGFFMLFKESARIKATLFLWMLSAPVAASLSIPSPHALRSLQFLPTFQIVTAIGIVSTVYLLGKRGRAILSVLFFIVVTFSVFSYLSMYYKWNTTIASKDWADGYKQLTEYIFLHENKYEKVIVSGHYWEPYIYLLFYKKYNPVAYQRNGSPNGFDKYIFGGTSWDKEKNSEELGGVNLRKFAKANKLLMALSPEEHLMQEKNVHKLTEIKDHNNQVIFIISEIQ